MKRSVPWRVGALTLVSAAILLGVLVVTGPLAVLSGARLQLDYMHAGPIKPGAAVRLSGVIVGAVEDVELLAGQDAQAGPEVMVRVHVRVQERALPAVTDKARFYVTTLGVLGEHYVDVEPRAGGTPLADGARVRGVDLARSDLLLPRAAALLEIMSALLDEGRTDALNLVQSATRLIEQLDRLLAAGDEAPILDEARALMVDVRELVAGLKTVVSDGRELRGTLRRGDRLAAGLESADLPRVLEDVRKGISHLDSTLGRVDAAPLLVPDRQTQLLSRLDEALASVDGLSRRADRLLAKIERGEGGAGRAFADEDLVDDLKAVLKELRTNPFQLLLPDAPSE